MTRPRGKRINRFSGASALYRRSIENWVGMPVSYSGHCAEVGVEHGPLMRCAFFHEVRRLMQMSAEDVENVPLVLSREP